MQARAFEESDTEAWAQLIESSPMGTFLMTRRYLSYHGNRFEDRSVVLADAQRLLAVIPAAADPEGSGAVICHPGITYGGLVHDGLDPDSVLYALKAACRHWSESGHERVLYKAIPAIYHRRPAMEDRYALFRLGGRLTRTDLSCAVDLSDRGRVSSQRKRGQKRARKASLTVSSNIGQLDVFWKILEDNLASRHQVRPAHTADEMLELHRRFPQAIRLVGAELDGRLIAGTVLFCTPTVHHAQYIGCDALGRQLNALDLIFETLIEQATELDVRFFDFGVSTEQQGLCLNTGLHAYKASFGGSGVVHEFYSLDL